MHNLKLILVIKIVLKLISFSIAMATTLGEIRGTHLRTDSCQKSFDILYNLTLCKNTVCQSLLVP